MYEKLFKKVNQLARKLHISRSRLFVMAVQDFIKKQENQKLLAQINDAFYNHPDYEESRIQSKMRLKQAEKFEREPWQLNNIRMKEKTTCKVCKQGKLYKREVGQKFERDGLEVRSEGIPALVCDNCG